jgi:drug/metabolite transporter (DMT)-like permease
VSPRINLVISLILLHTIFINLVPVSAIALAAMILREPIDPSIIIGGELVISGVFCANRG